jgi:hypothetical protein
MCSISRKKILLGRKQLFADLEAASYQFEAFFGASAPAPIKMLIDIRSLIIVASRGLAGR